MMEALYYEVTSEIDAREILRYLNDLGIHNISGEVLKYFIRDLKKFIKYDLQTKYANKQTQEVEAFERLHSASTFSSRLKSKTQESGAVTCTRECQKTRSLFKVRNVKSAPSFGQKNLEDEQPLKRACSCVKMEKREGSSATIPRKSTISSANLIKVQKQPVAKKCDPVQLYHYYTSLWAKYKTNVPGENSWADLRWEMRKKMAGAGDAQQVKKVREKLKPEANKL